MKSRLQLSKGGKAKSHHHLRRLRRRIQSCWPCMRHWPLQRRLWQSLLLSNASVEVNPLPRAEALVERASNPLSSNDPQQSPNLICPIPRNWTSAKILGRDSSGRSNQLLLLGRKGPTIHHIGGAPLLVRVCRVLSCSDLPR